MILQVNPSYLIISIISSITISVMLINTLFPIIVKYSKGREKNKIENFFFNRIIFIFFFSIIQFIIIYVITKPSKIDLTKIRIEIEQKAKKDSLTRIHLIELKKRDTVLSVLTNYFKASAEKNISEVDKYYKYPLWRFYTLRNVSRERVHERTLFYWRNFPNGNPNGYKQNTNISINSKGEALVFVSWDNLNISKTVSYVLCIYLDKNYKIYSIYSFAQARANLDSVMTLYQNPTRNLKE